jgi:steroid 5-alpha reductase family enzyme
MKQTSKLQHNQKARGIVVIGLIYLIVTLLGILVFRLSKGAMSEMLALFLADVVATVAVWGFGLFYKNVSVYDPYWSVAPPVMFTIWAIYKSVFTLPVVLLLIAVWYWGIRLTCNWAFTFKGLSYEDWRYTRYRETQSLILFQVTNFFGLNMMPTVLVFVAMLPGFGLFEGTASANIITWIGFVICITAATVQLVADTQIHRFRETHIGQYCDVGLWKHGRHPNYFGEITMWWGVWTMYASLYGLNWLIIGPVAMTALFLFISIPMMEQRQLQNKPGYAEYRKKTRRLI